MLPPAIMKYDHASRFLFAAFFLSLLLHLLLIFGWGWQRVLPPTMAQPAIQVIVSAKTVAAPAPISAPAPTPTAQPPLRPAQPIQPARPRPKEATPPVLALERPAPPPESLPVAVAEAAPATGRESASPAPAAPGPAKVAASDAVEGVSADSLREYRIELAGAARRFRSYPAIARLRGWEGVAEVVVSVNAGVPLPSLKLVHSSGHPVLDEQAVEMLSRAVAATPLPASLRGRSFVVPMPIRFSLEE
jgi:protein TonB